MRFVLNVVVIVWSCFSYSHANGLDQKFSTAFIEAGGSAHSKFLKKYRMLLKDLPLATPANEYSIIRELLGFLELDKNTESLGVIWANQKVLINKGFKALFIHPYNGQKINSLAQSSLKKAVGFEFILVLPDHFEHDAEEFEKSEILHELQHFKDLQSEKKIGLLRKLSFDEKVDLEQALKSSEDASATIIYFKIYYEKLKRHFNHPLEQQAYQVQINFLKSVGKTQKEVEKYVRSLHQIPGSHRCFLFVENFFADAFTEAGKTKE